ncbi:predicted protein [Histoplasma capsulatum G186AR]|uniref:Uncharacterized protein n=1 Tax=Ajellomyces capsulatus (strain G186AR / H82 / ATCC MYA-2454 / RMSCC 2432) TaxID=447093 RepID=C0NT56_AJECG|nr:uncharacterized protein HCBG_06336 [Histoplasma capsulatum G186AR]EEH05217.1 predicted protein [Histoplasma capsulatum G186AR]
MVQHDPTSSNVIQHARDAQVVGPKCGKTLAGAGKGRHALSADQADQVSRSGCLVTGKPGWDVLCFSADSVSGLGSGDRGLVGKRDDTYTREPRAAKALGGFACVQTHVPMVFSQGL